MDGTHYKSAIRFRNPPPPPRSSGRPRNLRLPPSLPSSFRLLSRSWIGGNSTSSPSSSSFLHIPPFPFLLSLKSLNSFFFLPPPLSSLPFHIRSSRGDPIQGEREKGGKQKGAFLL